jgi:hypothetical protein
MTKPLTPAARLETQKALELPLLVREATLQTSTLSEEAREIELVWSTGARRLTWSWEEWGVIEEELALDEGACDLSRLNARAPLLNAHSTWQLRDVIGVTSKAWLAGAEARALVRFSKRAEVTPIWEDVKDGILCQVSIGYQVRKYVVTREEGKAPLYRAVDWCPYEISIVPVGADPGASIRSALGAPPEKRPPLFPVQIQLAPRAAATTPAPSRAQEKKPMKPEETAGAQKRAMSDDAKAKAKEILIANGMAEDKLDACLDQLAALWPAEETAEGEGQAALDEAARALGVKGEATPARIAAAAKTLRALADAEGKRADQADAEGDDDESVFAANEAKGLHRNLNKVDPKMARDLFDNARGVYEEKIKGVKPLVGAKPPAAAGSEQRSTVAKVADAADDMERAVLAEEKRLLQADPKLTPAEAYRRAFQTVQAQRKPAAASR